MQDETTLVPVKRLAEQLGMDRSHALRLVKRLGIETVSHRSSDTRNQASSAVTTQDAERCIEWRKAHGYGSESSATLGNVLYAVAVDPEARPGRVKVGTTTNQDGRFSAYRTTCPEMAVLKTWAVPQSCEGYLIALADSMGIRVGQELFDLDDVGAFIERATAALSFIEGFE
jgi:hypothetical protein